MEAMISLQYRLLKRLYPRSPELLSEDKAYAEQSKLDLLGDELASEIRGKTVIDFGCGTGGQAIELVQRGAGSVIGLDIREDWLDIARRRAIDARVDDKCRFATTTSQPADLIISLDAFEHFHDPAGILTIMSGLLKPGGEVLFSFGPTWHHPLGGHLLSVFPWAHLILSERALLRWRSTFKQDNATRFSEVAGGLNQMTIGRFERLVRESNFQLAHLECVPISKVRAIHTRFTREFTTAVVRGRLVKPKDTAKASNGSAVAQNAVTPQA